MTATGPLDQRPEGDSTVRTPAVGSTNAARTGPGPARCSFCGYHVAAGPVTDETVPSETFCSAVCRDASVDGERPFAGDHGYKYCRTGVRALDRVLPQGIRTDSLVLLRGEIGTGLLALQFELAWRAVQRGEPVVVVSYLDPPTAVVERFLALGWNVLPALERDLLHVVDCFTRRLSDVEEFVSTRNRWNEFLAGALDATDGVTEIRNPDDLREVENRVVDAASDHDLNNRGAVLIDSLEEMGTLVTDPQVENFLKEVRADVSMNRFVPLIVGQCADRATGQMQQQMRLTGGGLTTDVTYITDGIVDVRLNQRVVPAVRLKQLSVRGMRGVRYVPQWVTFEFGTDGHVTFDPTTETRTVYDPGRLAADAPPVGGGRVRSARPDR